MKSDQHSYQWKKRRLEVPRLFPFKLAKLQRKYMWCSKDGSIISTVFLENNLKLCIKSFKKFIFFHTAILLGFYPKEIITNMCRALVTMTFII